MSNLRSTKSCEQVVFRVAGWKYWSIERGQGPLHDLAWGFDLVQADAKAVDQFMYLAGRATHLSHLPQQYATPICRA